MFYLFRVVIKGFMLTFMVRSPSFSDSRKKTFHRKRDIKTIHHHGPYDSGTKRFGAPVLSKYYRKAKRRAFRITIQQFFNKLFFLSLSFCFWQIRRSEPLCTTVVWESLPFDVMFSGKYVYVSRRFMAIEPITTLNLLFVSELVHNTEWRDKNFINFFTSSFLGMIC